MAKAIMIQGTMSNAGKSLIAAGLCRVFTQDGYRVAPFKSQNMALNSFITKDGKEMGRAQVVQAEACKKEPDVRMNPILLKPTTDMGSQVILMGEVCGNMKAMDYFKKKKDYIPMIMEAYESLAKENDIIVIEGAGSPVEINLKENDIVNMGMAKLASANVLLVGDIDRGGVFAQLMGTMDLLEEEERKRVKGIIVNKFRGDLKILEPGISMLEDKCACKVVGVVPYSDVHLEDEDSLGDSLNGNNQDLQKQIVEGLEANQRIEIAVIRLGKISNYTDFDPFCLYENVMVRYVDTVKELGNPDLIILPGSKNTIADLKLLKETGLFEEIKKQAKNGTIIFGICGGYQLLGEEIVDEFGVESGALKEHGLGLLPMKTWFSTEKTTTQSNGKTNIFEGIFEGLSNLSISGYEIHMGHSEYVGEDAISFASFGDGNDGCISKNVLGTYLHGILECDEFRDKLLEIAGKKKGICPVLFHDLKKENSFLQYKEKQYDLLADIIRESLDMEAIYKAVFDDNEALADEVSDETTVELPYKDLAPMDIEKKSFEILSEELLKMGIQLGEEEAPIIKRAIHTTADFEYAKSLYFSENVIKNMRDAIGNGACIVTDTQMAKSGINKKKLAEFGGEVYCFMSDEDVALKAKETGQTRATISMEKAAKMAKETGKDLIFAIGNAPTALIKLDEMMKADKIRPKGIIAVPVGFVNVVEAKELIVQSDCNAIVARGRKGGSNVAAAICNALLYGM